jgi:hypothetical protein
MMADVEKLMDILNPNVKTRSSGRLNVKVKFNREEEGFVDLRTLLAQSVFDGESSQPGSAIAW